jgi:putative transposase
LSPTANAAFVAAMEDVLDDFSRECLALVADTSLSGRRVARELDRIGAYRKLPCLIASDNVLRQEAGYLGRRQISVH